MARASAVFSSGASNRFGWCASDAEDALPVLCLSRFLRHGRIAIRKISPGERTGALVTDGGGRYELHGVRQTRSAVRRWRLHRGGIVKPLVVGAAARSGPKARDKSVRHRLA
jgi:hypothetical protein